MFKNHEMIAKNVFRIIKILILILILIRAASLKIIICGHMNNEILI